MSIDLELVTRARSGDRHAIEGVVRESTDLVFNLAVRMLGDRTDAEDCTQEILVRVVNGLGSFRGDSSFRTWVYRVASNYLLTARKRLTEQRIDSFDKLEGNLDAGIAADLPPPDDAVLLTEAKLTCTAFMLLGLDREQRLAFVLGEILDLSSEEGADVLGITPEAFRKRLSRARDRMTEFTTRRCGLVDEANPCRCGKQVAKTYAEGHMKPPEAYFVTLSVRSTDRTVPYLEKIDRLQRAVAVLRGHPEYAAPAALVDGVRKLMETGRMEAG
jgi:RNA polymerase sigma factor (sigma-70 family)